MTKFFHTYVGSFTFVGMFTFDGQTFVPGKLLISVRTDVHTCVNIECIVIMYTLSHI